MRARGTYSLAAMLVGVVAAATWTIAEVQAQKATPADIAAKISGTWVVNLDQSPGLHRPAGRQGFLRTPSGVRVESAVFMQRRGGGGGMSSPSGPSDLTPRERAEQAAIATFQQAAQQVTIKATADSVTFTDSAGERTYAVNGKNNPVDVNGVEVDAKSHWDKNTLKQEFSAGGIKITHVWEPSADGAHLTFTLSRESMRGSGKSVAVYDRKP
ncbi:MAG TPA: hypothetical protein VHD57_08640 [Vicinamibacterales bacterium]|nr:hypothetical protein [Vicinamibacterales bacterium]